MSSPWDTSGPSSFTGRAFDGADHSRAVKNSGIKTAKGLDPKQFAVYNQPGDNNVKVIKQVRKKKHEPQPHK